MTKIEHRAEMMQDTAQRFAALMETNDELAAAIEAALEDRTDEEAMQEVYRLHAEFKNKSAHVISGLSVVVAQIDNSSAAMFLGTVAGLLVEAEIEHNPIALLSELLGGGQ